MDTIKDFLSDAQLTALQDDYDRDAMTAALTTTLPRLYDPSYGYVDAIAVAFYGSLPDDSDPPPRAALSVQDRERCVIALLTSRRGTAELALYIYIGLMEGLSAEEIANIILLAGIYTGGDNFSRGLLTERATLIALAGLVDRGDPLDAPSVMTRLVATFEPSAQASGT